MNETPETKVINYGGKAYNCPLAFSLQLIGDKYKSLIIFHLKDGALRSGELQKSITDLSNRMFTYSIRALEKDMLVRRIVYPVSPPRVEYELTEDGKSLIPIILELDKWGQSVAKNNQLYTSAD